jgi:predicted RNase H-like nuclease (RuvC/YqgF family)
MIPAILALSVLVFGCKVKELADKARIAKDLDKRGTLDLIKDVSNDKYDPPKDGKLTEAQIQMYLKVRTHEKDIAKVALADAQKHADAGDKAKNSIAGVMEGFRTMSSAAQFATADIRAAKDLGYNTQEYLWVKAQVTGASMAAFAEGMTKAMSVQQDAYLAQTRKAYEEAKDEQTKQMYKQMLDNYAQTVKEGKEATAGLDPAVAYNRQLLKKYDTELAAFTTEMSKYESKEGEAQKAMDELQKKMQELSNEPKKSQ